MDTSYIYLGLASTVAGWLMFYIFYKMLPARLKSSTEKQRQEILADAKTNITDRTKSDASREQTRITIQLDELESDIEDRKRELKESEEDLEIRHRTWQMEESRVSKLDAISDKRTEKLDQRRAEYLECLQKFEAKQEEIQSQLGVKAGADAEKLKSNLTKNITEIYQIQSQKTLKFLNEELESNSRRISSRMLSRTLARYAPEFYWPKSVNFVELPHQGLVDTVAAQGEPLMNALKETAGIEIDLLADNAYPIIKLAGGAGINREAVRQTFNEIIKKHPNTWGNFKPVYDKHRATLEQEAILLGRKAVNKLELSGIHPEVQKLIGYLNWRTSYRQNQWHHTVEVATLSGILGTELGLDPDESKRVGLLHDIGKAIDYKIEGSHAVISADYADRYGEKRLICDTVLSHHNDLAMETALSYVLKAADTFSGARPGARVNLEEGYQMRLSGIDTAIRSFKGVIDVAIMNGAKEVHVEVNHKVVKDEDMKSLAKDMAQKVSEEVAFPGEIKIQISRILEATSVA